MLMLRLPFFWVVPLSLVFVVCKVNCRGQDFLFCFVRNTEQTHTRILRHFETQGRIKKRMGVSSSMKEGVLFLPTNSICGEIVKATVTTTDLTEFERQVCVCLPQVLSYS